MASSSSSSSPEISHTAPACDPSFFSYASLDDVLEELSTRFIMNLPDQELESVERICFQVEQAHWYYEDFMREANPKLPTFTLKKFSSLFFNSCPLLRQWSSEHEQYFNTFMHYKVRVPVCGAIMLNDKWDKCILVKGWKSSAGWGFPKGKINQNEPAHECAAREVGEETGFNISSLMRPKDYIEMTIREQKVTLFIVGGVPEDYPFHTRTRKEISKIEWFKLSDLPSWKRNKQVPGKFYLISPFVNPLKEFIRVNKPTKRRQNRRKNRGDSNADLTIQTDLEGDNEVEDVDERKQSPSPLRAVNLDRDLHGYSSSSVDNGEPQTPSPQSTEALPVATADDTEGRPDHPMDSHLARLLNGLSLSASKHKLSMNGIAVLRPTSITPTSAKSGLASGVENKAAAQEDLTVGDVEATDAILENSEILRGVLSSADVKSPTVSSRSDTSIVTIKPQSVQASPFESALPVAATASASDRHLKHLALLESIAQELSAPTPSPTTRQIPHPGPPSSVPPLPFDSDGRHLPLTGFISSTGPPNPTRFNAGIRPVLPMLDDPFMLRPMTSQGLSPPPPPPYMLRHGPNMSMHQGSLLSILSGSGGFSLKGSVPGRPLQAFNAMSSFGPGPGQPAAFVPTLQAQTQAPQLSKVIPPPPGPLHLNPGPLTTPIPSRLGIASVTYPQTIPNTTINAHKAQPNPAHLLSLLNSHANARPAPTLVADTKWPNFPAGSPTAPSH